MFTVHSSPIHQEKIPERRSRESAAINKIDVFTALPKNKIKATRRKAAYVCGLDSVANLPRQCSKPAQTVWASCMVSFKIDFQVVVPTIVTLPVVSANRGTRYCQWKSFKLRKATRSNSLQTLIQIRFQIFSLINFSKKNAYETLFSNFDNSSHRT